MHPFEASLAKLNPKVDQDSAAEALRNLMEQWSVVMYQTRWHANLPTALWIRILLVDPTNPRLYGTFELTLLERIAKMAIKAGGWWTEDLFLTTEQWEAVFNPAQPATRNNSVVH